MQIKLPQICKVMNFRYHPKFMCSDSNKSKIESESSSLIKNEIHNKPVDQTKKLNNFWKTYRNHLIQVVQESEPQKPKGTEDYRISILFDEVLKKQKLIELYNTQGRVFLVTYLTELLLLAFGFGGLYYLYQKKRWKKRFEDKLKLGICILFIVSRFHLYRRFQKYHVEKLVYSTESKNFILSMRNIIGWKTEHQLLKEKLLFTQDKYLNAKNINYINIDTMDCYQIGYTYAWKNKDLFTHLIKQNIQNIRKA